MVYFYGKLIGAAFGAIFGPLGFIIGLIAGHFFDKGLALNANLSMPDIHLAKEIFFKSTFMVMGYIAKSDGRVSEQEIAAARNVMTQLHLTPEQKMKAIEYFNYGKSSRFNWTEVMDNFVKNCGYHPQLIQMFIEFQLRTAFADGVRDPSKRYVLEQLCYRLNLPSSVLTQMESQFYAEKVFREPRHSPQDELTNAYTLLGITEAASDAQVKKAYRTQMSKHHPDKLVAKGLPPEMIQLATEKTQKIQKAYEILCQARGMK